MDWRNQLRFEGLNAVKKWWQERQPRERTLLAVCAVLLVGYICVALYKGYQAQFTQMHVSLEESQNDLVWVMEKKLDMLSLQQQGGYILTGEQLERVIESALAESNTNAASTINNSPQGWQVHWRGSTPSHFMTALTAMSSAGALIDNFHLSRTGNSTEIKVTIN